MADKKSERAEDAERVLPIDPSSDDERSVDIGDDIARTIPGILPADFGEEISRADPGAADQLFGEEPDVYRSIATAGPILGPAPHELGSNLHDSGPLFSQPKLQQQFHFQSLKDIVELPPLPPLPDKPIEKKLQPISSITKCPIKSYTTVPLSKDASPEAITSEVERVLQARNIECQMLQAGLKLRGSIVNDDDEQGSYETAGGVSFVFQLFYAEGDKHLIGVFRRLCGDVIAYNDTFREIRSDLEKGEIGQHIIAV